MTAVPAEAVRSIEAVAAPESLVIGSSAVAKALAALVIFGLLIRENIS